MKILKKLLLTISLLLLFVENSQAKVNIFACEPEWVSLSSEIGGDRVNIKQATSANQDPHHVRARPTLISAITRADLVFCTGLDLEVGWLPILLEKASKNVQKGADGYLMAGDFIDPLEITSELDRSFGDVHAFGNPHMHLDPRNIVKVAKELANRLEAIDPDSKVYYQQNLDNFVNKWQKLIINWQKQTKDLKNMKIITHHKSWVYLTNWLGLDVVASLEETSGVTPTVKYLSEVLTKAKTNNVKLIIRTPFENEKASNWVSKKSNITAVVLPFTVDDKDNKDLEKLFNNIIKELLKWN